MLTINDNSNTLLSNEEMLEIVLVAMKYNVNKNYTVQILNISKGMFTVSQNDIGYIISNNKED